jgi:Tfp pilus assembly protein FimV
MVDIDKDGVDRLATRRQQLENWTNQRNLRDTQISANEQLAFMEGLDDEPARVMTSAGYFDQMTAGMEQTKMDKFKDMAPDDGSPPPKWFSATAGAKDDMEVVLANGVADLLEVFNDAIGYVKRGCCCC